MFEENTDAFRKVQWPALFLNLKNRRLVPFLGAGASLVHNGSVGLPTGAELASALARECAYTGNDIHDLPRVAQYFALAMGETNLRDSIESKLSLSNVKPGEIHKIIAGWPVEVVLTTNFDSLMERAFAMFGKDPFAYCYERRGNQQQIKTTPSINRPLVYKLHGSLDKKDTMVVTEDDTIDFLVSMIKGDPKIPDTIGSLFTKSSILFIGYGLKDWNIRVLLRYFRETQADIRSFAIQRFKPYGSEDQAAQEWESMVLYWEHKKISVYNCDALEFLREFDRRYRTEG